ELAGIRLGRHDLVLLYGEEAQEAFFRASDEQLDQAAAYPFMKPIFGAGVVFDAASPEQRKQAMKNQALQDTMMRGHAETIASETERMIESWGASGEIDLLDFFAELTLYTSSACLVGKEFREELTPEYTRLFQELERGTDWLAYISPYLPLPSFRTRDRARRRLVELIQGIIDSREREGRKPSDLVAVLTSIKNEDGTPRYNADIVTGMFIAMMFAGHHTTSGTAAWTLIELLRNPGIMGDVVAELDTLFADGREVSYQALREIPELECSIKESLRLHPPLIMLSRIVQEPFKYKGWTVEKGTTLSVSPAVSNRMPEVFPDPDRFDPGRYKNNPSADRRVFAWLPFGGGRHRCVGAQFAIMQLKTIFSVLLRRYSFEMSQPAASYRDAGSRMVVQLEQPCRVRYHRREAVAARATTSPNATVAGDGAAGDACPAASARTASGACPASTAGTASAASTAAGASAGRARIEVDLDLCQGHGVCVGEAPELFEVDVAERKVRLRTDRITAEQRDRAERAVKHCPTSALRLLDD
ncbi:MAG: cytochrome P450, partial [Candidatus Binatia bacterium]